MIEFTKRIKLNAKDKEILESYKTVLEGLSDYLGNGFEFVLHSLDDLDNSVIKIINGFYTNREVGSPITNLALSMLTKFETDKSLNYISYFNKDKSGRRLKSTTIAIKGTENKLIGLLCINFYMDTSVMEFLNPYFYNQDDGPGHTESFVSDIDDVIISAINDAKLEVEKNPKISSTNVNKEIILRLNEKGIFNLKDSVIKVSKILHISKNTVYLHLRSIKK